MSDFDLVGVGQSELARGSWEEVTPAMQCKLQSHVRLHTPEDEEGTHHGHCIVEARHARSEAAAVAADRSEDKILSREIGILKLCHPVSGPIRVGEASTDRRPRDLASFFLHLPTDADESVDCKMDFPGP